MTISLSSLAPSGGGGGSGLYRIVAVNTGRLSAGLSGTVLTDTAGTDQYIKLTYLAANNQESGMTLTIDGIDILSNKNLSGKVLTCTATSNAFAISTSFGTVSNSSDNAGILQNVHCTSFSLTKLVGSTASYIEYSYEVLEAI